MKGTCKLYKIACREEMETRGKFLPYENNRTMQRLQEFAANVRWGKKKGQRGRYRSIEKWYEEE